jgi:hypothetical protein
MEKKIFSDEEVFEQIKPASRKAYEKCWKEFKEINPEINFEEGRPGEEAIVIFFKHLRFEKKEKRVHVPGVHLFQQASHLGHGKQAWGV